MVTTNTCRYCKKNLPEDKFHVKKNGDKSNACITCWEKYYLSTRDNPNICGNCRRVYDEDFGLKSNGEPYKTCLRCRTKNLEKYYDDKDKYKDKYRCPHGKYSKIMCKNCADPIDVTIKNWIRNCRCYDKKNDIFDADHFIDTDFLKGLTEDYHECYYDDCRVELQYIENRSDLATIERLNNLKGHIKSNCVLCCFSCSAKRKSNNGKNKPELADELSDKLVLTK